MQLEGFPKVLNAENSDRYDAWAFVAFHSSIFARSVRVANEKVQLHNYDTILVSVGAT